MHFDLVSVLYHVLALFVITRVAMNLSFARGAIWLVIACVGSIWLQNREIPIEATIYEQYTISLSPAFMLMGLYSYLLYYASIHSRITTRLLQNLRRLEKQQDEAYQRVQAAVLAKENLEKHLLQEDSFTLKLQEAISRFSSADPYSMRDEIISITREFILAESISFYTFEDDTFKLVASHEYPEAPVELKPEDPAIARICSANQVLSARDEDHEGDFVLAAFLKRSSGWPVGLLFIHDMDFLELNASKTNLFGLLANWISMEFEKNDANEKLLMNMVKLQNVRYFFSRIWRAALQARDQNTSITVLTIILLKRSYYEDTRWRERVSEFIEASAPILGELMHNMFFNELRDDRTHYIVEDYATLEPTLQKWLDEQTRFELKVETLELNAQTSGETVQIFLEEQSEMRDTPN